MMHVMRSSAATTSLVSDVVQRIEDAIRGPIIPLDLARDFVLLGRILDTHAGGNRFPDGLSEDLSRDRSRLSEIVGIGEEALSNKLPEIREAGKTLLAKLVRRDVPRFSQRTAHSAQEFLNAARALIVRHMRDGEYLQAREVSQRAVVLGQQIVRVVPHDSLDATCITELLSAANGAARIPMCRDVAAELLTLATVFSATGVRDEKPSSLADSLKTVMDVIGNLSGDVAGEVFDRVQHATRTWPGIRGTETQLCLYEAMGQLHAVRGSFGLEGR